VQSELDTLPRYVISSAAVYLAQQGDATLIGTFKRRFYDDIQDFTGYLDRYFAEPYEYLYALYLVGAPETKSMIHQYVDTLVARASRGDDARFESDGSRALRLLASMGDYSRYTVFEALMDEEIKSNQSIDFPLLVAFAGQSDLREAVFERLKSFVNASNERYRGNAAICLARDFRDNAETHSILRTVAMSDSSVHVRDIAILSLMNDYGDPLALVASENIARATEDTLSFAGAVAFIEFFPSPLGLATLQHLLGSVSFEYKRGFITRAIEYYKPARIHTEGKPVVELVDSLESYVHQVSDLGWLADANFVNELDNDLENAREHLAKGDSVNAYEEVQKFQEKIQKEYDKTQENEKKNKPRDKRFVTTEGYKFLYYNAQYILDRLPAQPQEPPFVAQVDSLSASLTTAHANGWIGDRALVKSLSGQMTDARKNLGKGNLTRASAQLQNFLNRLQKVYHHTLEEQQKGKRRPKNFVTEGGFAFLAGKTTELLTKLGSLGEILSVPGQFTTIQAAVNAAKPGATIAVDAGTYKELVEIQKKDSLTLLASEDVTIQGVRIARCNVITVKGFTIDAAGTKKDGVEIEGQENTDITIEANEITNSSKDGISAGKHNVRTRIVNNVIAGNEKNGIDFADGTDGAQYVLNNTIVKNGWNGVEAASQKNLSLVNNIISFNGTAKGDAEGRYGVKREGKAGAGKIVVLNNLIIGNGGKVNKQNSKDIANYDQVLDGTDSGNITSTGAEGAGVSGSSAQSFSDLLLADYRLTDTSIAIDKGTVSFAAPDAEAGKLPEEDKDGNPRPQRTSIDLGAFELE
jgi:hypothetical protein